MAPGQHLSLYNDETLGGSAQHTFFEVIQLPDAIIEAQ